MTETFIKNIQGAFSQEAGKRAGLSETPPDNSTPPPEGNKPEKQADHGKPAEGDASLSSRIKEKYDVELTDEEIQEFVNQKKSKPPEKPVSETPPSLPKAEDVSDDEVGQFLEQNGRTRDIITRANTRTTKKDLEVVKDHHVTLIKQQFPTFDEQQAEQLFNERFYIEEPEEGQTPLFTPEEQKLGQYLLKQEAERLRNEDKYVLDNVRAHLYQGKMKEHNDKVHARAVDDFIKTAPKKLTIDIGKSGAKNLGSYDVQLEDDTLKEVAQIMKDPARLSKKFTDDKGQLDFQKLFNFLVRDEIHENIYKSLASHYHSEGLSEIESTLNNEPVFGFRSNGLNEKKNKSKEVKEAEDFNAKQVSLNVGKRVRR